MSTKENDLWVEAAEEFFDEALASGNYPAARDIITDTRSQGFERQAAQMELALQNTPISDFIHVSPFQVVGEQMDTLYNLARGKNADGSDKK